MHEKKTNVAMVTVAIFIGTFMTAIEGTIVATAMPTIVGSLHGVSMMNWIISIYLLTNAMATPIYGKFADRIGRKPVFLIGLAVFLVGSTLSGLSTSMPFLIISRAIQGVGAGAIMPVTFTIIADIYPYEKRAKVLGFNGSAWGIASVVAPLLGGFIVDKLSWHWIFFINVPVGLLTMLMVVFFLHEEKRTEKAPVDYLGTALLSGILLVLMLAFQALAQPKGFLWLALGLVLAGAFGYGFWTAEKRAKDPIIDLSLFKNRAFVVANVNAALISGFVIGFETYMPMWVQGINGLRASLGGFVITPSSLMWILGSFVAGRMIVTMSPQRVMGGAMTILLFGSFALAVLPQHTPYSWFLIVAAFLGLGFGIVITTTTVRAQAVVDPSVIGVATSFNTLSRTLGQTLMVSIYGVVLNLRMSQGIAGNKSLNSDMLNKLVNPDTAKTLPADLLPALREILYNGLHSVYFFSVVIVAIGLLFNYWDSRHKAQDTLA